MSELKIYIDGQLVDTDKEETGVPVSYKLEENSDFQKKGSSSALSVVIPATKNNSQISNSFHNPSIEDLTTGEAFKNARAASIVYRSWELLTGKAFLKSAKFTDRPKSYAFDFYGDNADWLTNLANTTLYDLLQRIQFTFDTGIIESSWNFDGNNESMPFVFAPVRYGQTMDEGPANTVMIDPPIIKDYSMAPEYMKPSLSVYWIIKWGFRLAGYSINSVFMELPYFKKLVMPWTWGNFLYSDGTRTQNLTFLAKSTAARTYTQDFEGDMDLLLSNDSTNGAFDDNDVYTYDANTGTAKWTYSPDFDYGTLEATFHLQVNYNYVSTDGGDVEARVRWYKNGVQVQTGSVGENANGDKIFKYSAPTVGGDRDAKITELWTSIVVNAGDVVEAKFHGWLNDTGVGTSHMTLEILSFDIAYFRVPIGGTIKFDNFLSFKNYKFLDFFRGIVDSFNLIPKADSITKVITIEPQHPYVTNKYINAVRKGYFNGNVVDWTYKQDLEKESDLRLFDDYNRNVIFKFKDDGNDGILKLIQDRYSVTLAQGKYVLPERFVNEDSTVENRFFSPVMHYNVAQWKTIGDLQDAPQMVCMVPENVSNTSHEESQNTFSPKLCWYKGLIEGYGWVFNKGKKFNYPFMFAVNYKTGGDDDPVLSYSDENLLAGPTYLVNEDGILIISEDTGKPIIVDPGGYPVIGKGLMRRFFLQRMAIMRNGQYLSSNFKLKNSDVANVLHREHILCMNAKWELVEINNYNPVKEDSTACELRKHSPILKTDVDNCFPSQASVMGTVSSNPLDLKYNQLMALSTDIKSD